MSRMEKSTVVVNEITVSEDHDFLESSLASLTKEEQAFVRSASLRTLQCLLEDYMGSSHTAQGRHHDRKGILRRGGARAGSFVHNFAQYLAAYAGIVEVAKGIDEQYGGLAYGVLSLLLIVGVNKHIKERRIDETLLTLQREYLRMNRLPDVHSSKRLTHYIKEAFVLGIRFARFATEYYCRPSWRRVWAAVSKPPSLELDELRGEIAGAIAEVVKERDHLNTERLKKVEDRIQAVHETVRQSQGQVQGKVSSIKAQVNAKRLTRVYVEELRQQAIEDRLRLLRRDLNVAKVDQHEALKSYDCMLSDVMRRTARWSPLDFDQLRSHATYQKWSSDAASSLLLLYGKAHQRLGDCCWLSPAASQVAGSIRSSEQNGVAVATYLCQPNRSAEDPPAASEVLSSLAYQLIEQGRAALLMAASYERLSKQVSAVTGTPSSLEMHRNLLEHAMQPFRSVVLIIDRSDYVKGCAWRWLEHLAILLRNQPGDRSVKVLLIACSKSNMEPQGKLSPFVMEGLEEKLAHRFLRLELDNV